MRSVAVRPSGHVIGTTRSRGKESIEIVSFVGSVRRSMSVSEREDAVPSSGRWS
jgi:hypothetical protein